MAIQELSEEQIRTLTVEEKDQWWLTHVYKGDMPQLNFRSAITGMILGGILSLTNLYIGIKTGWTLGVGVTSVILSFALFKIINRFKLGKEMTLLENNAMQSIASSAGYMTAPLISSIPAYMLVTGQTIPMAHAFWWMVALSLLGVLFAFPLKKRFINDEQLPFPEGYAAGVVLDSLHNEHGQEGLFKAKVLFGGMGISSLIEVMRNSRVMEFFKIKFLTLPETWDQWIYGYFTPKILGTPLRDLTVQFDSSIVMIGTGGLMNLKTAVSLLLGAFLNYLVLAPILIHEGVIQGTGFKNITLWALWGGVALMTTSSLYSFFSKPKLVFKPLIEIFRKKSLPNPSASKNPLSDIELPLWISIIGIPILGMITILLGHAFFGLQIWLGLLAVPLVFVFTLIAVTSTGLTGITPGGALGKLTQITYSFLAPGNITTNIMTAGITAEVSLNASNLLMDIKPAYMLGGKPRHQALGYILGIFMGGWVAVPTFYAIFHGDISLLTSDKLPLPGAAIWKAVSLTLTHGLSTLHPSAKIAVLVGALLGVVLEILNQKTKGRFPLSGMGLGLAFVLRFPDSLAMALGALIFWYANRRCDEPTSLGYRIFVANQETLSAGVVAGGSIIGILLILIENVIMR